MAREAYAHDAVVELDAGGDPNALGGAVTVALCGSWDHKPPCPLAPHHTATVRADDTVKVRVLFATEPSNEQLVRSLIGEALASGRLTGPDGRATTWTLKSATQGMIRPDEADHASWLANN